MKPDSVNGTPPHGGDVYHLARSLGVRLEDLLDFSANINPLGYPAGVPAAVQAALANLVHYPDRRCFELRGDLAAYHGCSSDEILVGNGSTELIYLVVRALQPARALIVAPAFSEYQEALKAASVPFAFHLTSEADLFSLEQLPEAPGTELVFLANPASPSGALLSPERLLPWLEAWDAAGTYVALDEAFIDFAEEASLKTSLKRFPRLIIMRSFTKFFAIPGLRLGYLLAAPELVESFAAMQEPWSVSSLAQAVGRACLQDRDYMTRSRALVREERQHLFQGLQALPGVTAFPGQANYLLAKLTLPGWTARTLRERLLPRGIIIRDASNFQGLDERYFRVAVRRREDNDRLLAALDACLGRD
jgi:threonine-phosphate decarboxylase|uniref:threonine-phosphate decarboxylase n=1 Tax=Desulfobacca acetoxidans TaxID=60893 RepID=A0A7V6A4G7_9BACT